MTAGKEKIAILGGGVGALCAAVALTETDPHGEKYDITLYQLGWRLGGKCASGRNAAYGERIEEHGLHIWAGFYDNAFTIMRVVCKALNWKLEDLFVRQNLIFYADTRLTGKGGGAGDTRLWPFWFQPSSKPLQFPGRDSLWDADPVLPSLRTQVGRAIDGIIVAAEAWLNDWPGDPDNETRAALEQLSAAHQTRIAAGGVPRASEQSHHPLLEMARRCAAGLEHDVEDVRRTAAQDVKGLLHAFHGLMTGHFDLEEALPQELEIGLTLANLGIAMVVGVVKHDCLEKGLEAIDDIEFRDFLAEHNEAAANNLIVTALYEYIFGYQDGSRAKPRVSACSAVEGLIRLFFTYKDAFFMKGLYGMGDIICTPIYKLLQQRGVTFKFFHKVTELQPTADGGDIHTILVDVQAETHDDAPYQPFVTVQDYDCWPSEPHWSQLKHGETYKAEGVNFESAYGPVPQPAPAKTLTLERGQDFDKVILGISVGALAEICKPLVKQKPAWAAMVENLATVRTQAFQIWADKPVNDLNPSFLPPASMPLPAPETVGPIVTTCAHPFDTYADMSQLLPAEAWPSPAPKSVAYYCSVLEDGAPNGNGPPNNEEKAAAFVKEQASGWLSSWIDNIWPGVGSGPDFDWNLLHAPDADKGAKRFDTQFWRANIDPTERYVLSLPGTLKYRMAPGRSGYGNLFLAGDWTRVPEINAGCVEVAAMSGIAAASALSDVPIPIVSMTTLPMPTENYAGYGGWLSVPPAPVVSKNTGFYSFAFPADGSACQGFLDRSYNRAAGYTRFRPVVDRAFLNIVQVTESESPMEPYRAEGTMTEADVGFWLLVGDYPAGALLPRSIGWVPAYLFVDNAWATSVGREVWGMPKYYSTMVLPDAASPSMGPFEVSALAIKTFGPMAKAAPEKLLKLTGSGFDLTPIGGAAGLDALTAPFDLFERLCADVTGLKTLIDAKTTPTYMGAGDGGLPVFYLKQFRSADSTSAACYQALLQGPLALTKLHDAGLLLGDWALELHDVDSLPFIRDLGLGTPSGGTLRLSTDIGVWAKIDFEIGFATELPSGG